MRFQPSITSQLAARKCGTSAASNALPVVILDAKEIPPPDGMVRAILPPIDEETKVPHQHCLYQAGVEDRQRGLEEVVRSVKFPELAVPASLAGQLTTPELFPKVAQEGQA